MIIDGFSGPRGWSEGLRVLGLADVGIEWDAAACATAKAAGHLTIRADVATYPTGPFVGKTEGAILSPPCQAFSQAGKGDGVKAMAVLARAAWDVAGGADVPRLDLDDDRAELVLEPVRWVRDLRPRWVALEQVPPVLPLWELYAHIFGQYGYRCWTGKLNAANYGVPQTRERAILLASLDRQPSCPPATHCEGGEPESMFGAGRLSWVTMAEALGWYGQDTPARTVCGARVPRWMYEDRDGTHGAVVRTENRSEVGGDRVHYERSVDRPAPTVVSNADRWELRAGAMEHATVRSIDEPAPTVLASWDNGDTQWVLRGNQKPERASGEYQTRAVDRPAQTITGMAHLWAFDRPATTIAGDPRCWPPGHKVNGDDRARLGAEEADERYGDRAGTDAIRLTIRDALILQSFRANYPVQGNKSQQFRQVGDAIPPLLAAHCIAAVTGLSLPPSEGRATLTVQ